MALLGLPDDLGVRLNSGRAGAREGPRAFRSALAKYGVMNPDGWEWPKVYDAGDILPASGDTAQALHETHARVTAAVKALCGLGLFPVGIGGGHDLTFAFVRGVIEHARESGAALTRGVYFDAHLDVRAEVGSGMPMRALLEHCGLTQLEIRGFSALVNAKEHLEYFQARGGIIPGRPAQPPRAQGRYFASFDLDVLDASQAPGVSALNPDGWSVQRGSLEAERCGMDPDCACFDLMELCPAHDEGGRTARVAAYLFLSFLRGFARRPGATA